MAKSGNSKGKGATVAAYVLCLIVLGISIVYTVKNTKKEESAPIGELPVESWESDEDAQEGNVDKIVTQVVTDPVVESNSFEGFLFTPEEDSQPEVESDMESTPVQNEAEPVFNEDLAFAEEPIDQPTSEPSVNYSDYNMLELDGHTIRTAIDWSLFDVNKASPSEFSYTSGIYDVTVSLRNGSIEDFKPLIEAKATELEAGLVEEEYLFSSTRMNDTINYDKYTLVYTKDDTQYAAYYFLSQASDGYLYMATIRGTDELYTDSDVFNILDYRFE